MVAIMDNYGFKDILSFTNDIDYFKKRCEQRWASTEYEEESEEMKQKNNIGRDELNDKIFICLCCIIFFNIIRKNGILYLYQYHCVSTALYRYDALYKWQYLFCCKPSNNTLSRISLSYHDFYD